MKVILVSQLFAPGQSEEEMSKSLSLALHIHEFLYKFISPKDSSGYKVDEIKSFIYSTAKKNAQTEQSATVFLQAEKLSSICQNALLKTLEDSDKNMIFVTRSLDSLLPTLQSRCTIQYTNAVIKIDEKPEGLSLQKIEELSKSERDVVRQYMESVILSIDADEIRLLEYYEDALKKIQANCKVEAILLDLYMEINNVSK